VKSEGVVYLLLQRWAQHVAIAFQIFLWKVVLKIVMSFLVFLQCVRTQGATIHCPESCNHAIDETQKVFNCSNPVCWRSGPWKWDVQIPGDYWIHRAC